MLISYYEITEPEIRNILLKSRKEYVYEETIFGIRHQLFKSMLSKSHTVRQLQMKEGIIAQIMLGLFYGWEDLKSGHSSGLDLRKKDNSAVIELKNKHNTCNYGSQKSLLDKLATYKINNPETDCIWGIVNPKKSEKQ